MKKMHFLAALLGTVVFVSGCQTGTEPKADKVPQAIAKKFSQMLDAGQVPGLDKQSTGGNLDVAKVDDLVRSRAWFAPFLKDADKYQTVYWMSVESSGRKFFYLFNLDSGKPKLFASYRSENGRWVSFE